MNELLFPGSILLFGGMVLPISPARFRGWLAVLVALLSVAHLLSLPLGHEVWVGFYGYSLELVRFDALSRVFAIVFHIAAVFSMIFMLHVRNRLEHASALIYAGAAIGAACAGDLLTLFIFWELTALSSVFLIWARGTGRAYRAGMRYLIVQVLSGVLLLSGSFFYYQQTGSLTFGKLDLSDLGARLIFVAFGIKAAFPLLHNWLQDAYPEATVGGTVVLASFSTKLAIYALARSFAGTQLLIPIGALMTAFPIFFAVLENDLRRVLAYSLNNQLGFMVVGIGIGTELALNGAVAHAFAHIIYKGLLLMSMGAVLYRAGTIKANELGGLHRSMPITAALCIVGSMSIAGLPGLSGFVTKSMVVSATGAAHLGLTFAVLLFASAGVLDHSGIKVPFFAFFAHDSGRRVKEAPWHMLVAMAFAAALCIGIGLYPAPLYELLPYRVDYEPYSWTHVHTMLQLLVFAGLAFVLLMKMGLYPPELPSINLDSDWLYRRAIPRMWASVVDLSGNVRERLMALVERFAAFVIGALRRYYTPPGPLGTPWTTGTTSLWAVLFLALALMLYDR